MLGKIQDKIQVTKVEIERHTTTQSDSEHQAAQELERAKGAIKVSNNDKVIYLVFKA